MAVMNTLLLLAPLLVAGADPVPAPQRREGRLGRVLVFIGLAVAVAFLGFSLAKHLRRARDNAERGVFDSNDEPHRNTS